MVTNSDEIASRLRRLHQYGWSSKYKVEDRGGRNSRLDEMQAAALSVFLPDLDCANTRRRAIASEYSRAISNPHVQFPKIYGEEYVAHLYVIRAKQRDALRAHLKSCGISTEIHYPIPDHQQPIFSGCMLSVDLRSTERLSEEILTLPCYPEMKDVAVCRVISAVNSWLM